MTRVFPILTAAATAAFLTFGAAAAFAAAVGGDGNGQPGGPGAGNPGGPGGVTPRVYSCDYRADQQGLEGPARQAFVWRRQQGGAF
jgi:hypothetical protein